MNVESAIYNILKDNAGVSAVTGTRIYPNTAPQGTANPCIVFQERSVDPSDTKSGVSHLDTCYVGIDCYCDGQRASKELGKLVRTALDRYSGFVSDCNIQSIQFVDSMAVYDYAAECYRTYVEFKVRQII